jgi:hypothetical protein
MKQLILLALLALGACAATEERYKRNMENLVGTPESALRAQWGPPDTTYTRDGTTYLTYTRSRQMGARAATGTTTTGPTYFGAAGTGGASPGGGGGAAGGGAVKPCKTMFTASDGVIRTWRAEGSGCRA